MNPCRTTLIARKLRERGICTQCQVRKAKISTLCPVCECVRVAKMFRYIGKPLTDNQRAHLTKLRSMARAIVGPNFGRIIPVAAPSPVIESTDIPGPVEIIPPETAQNPCVTFSIGSPVRVKSVDFTGEGTFAGLVPADHPTLGRFVISEGPQSWVKIGDDQCVFASAEVFAP